MPHPYPYPPPRTCPCLLVAREALDAGPQEGAGSGASARGSSGRIGAVHRGGCANLNRVT